MYLLFLKITVLFVVVSSDTNKKNSCLSQSKDGTKDCGCSMTSRTQNPKSEEGSVKEESKLKYLSPDIENSGKKLQGSDDADSIKYGSMVLIPGGNFTMGTNNPKIISDGEGPGREVKLSPFYMDQYEASNHNFEAFVNATEYLTEVR